MGDTHIIPPFEKGNPDTTSGGEELSSQEEKNFHTTQHLEGELLPIGKGGALRFHITK